MAPTHRDTDAHGKRPGDIRDEVKQISLTDLPTLIPKILGLASALFLALLSASPRVPGLMADSSYVISAAIALTACIAWACWFETLMHEKLAHAGIWSVLLLVIIGLLIHLVNVEKTPAMGMPLGILALICAIVGTIVFVSKRMLYPKLEFFLPATALLCLWAVTNVI